MLGFWTPSGAELVVILVIGLLLFGKRLPEVGRSLGKAIVEFKKGVKGIEDEVGQGAESPGASRPSLNAATDARRVSTSEKIEENV
ncbi:MAG: twin-arginine translocase TatA/TatE family subunit [Phycisphaerae bacterium]|nr:twin-arginine translocase TatA/TatE family subunit [Phycisphaerae bacterium]